MSNTELHARRAVGAGAPPLDNRQVERSRRVAGFTFLLTAAGIVMSTITNEAIYPRRYSTNLNTISDLSGTEPPHSIMVEPSRTIFVVTMMLAGLLVLVGTWHLARVVDRRRLVIAMTVFGVGLVGIAVLPGNVEGWHPLFAFCAFLGGASAAIQSRHVIGGPFRHVALTAGVIALLAVAFGVEALEDWGPQAALGVGGIERWIAYPVLLWLFGFGAFLLAPKCDRPFADGALQTGTTR